MGLIENPLYIFENYGWYLLGICVILAYFYHKNLKTYIASYKKQRDEEEYAAKYHKNPDLFVARQIAQQQYAMKLQEKYKQDVEEYEKKMKEKQDKKQEQLLEKYKGLGGEKTGYREDKENSFKPEYNPLMGAGGSSNYRPPRRSACSGGGCG